MAKSENWAMGSKVEKDVRACTHTTQLGGLICLFFLWKGKYEVCSASTGSSICYKVTSAQFKA
jgi:hypothetical protein